MKNYTRKTAIDTAGVFAFSIIAALFAYMFRYMLSQKLELAEFGLFFSLFAFLNILLIFRDLGLSQAGFFFVPKHSAKKETNKLKGLVQRIFQIETGATIGLAIALALAAGMLSRSFFNTQNSGVVLLFVVIFVLNSFELIFQSMFNAFQNNLTYAIQNMTRNVLYFVFALASLSLFAGIYGAISGVIISLVIMIVVFPYVFFKKTFPDYFSIKADYPKIKGLLMFGAAATLYSFGATLIVSTDTLMITYFRTLEDVGLYNAALPIVNLIMYLPFAMGSVLMPMSSELWAKKDLQRLRFAVETALKYVMIYLVPAAAVLMTYPTMILTILFGAKFAGATMALKILAGGIVFYCLGHIALGFNLVISGPKYNMHYVLAAAATNLLLNGILTSKYGITGAATATAISYFLIFVLASRQLYKAIGLHFDTKRFAGIIVAGGLFIVSITYLKTALELSVITEILISVITSLGIYLVALFLMRIIDMQEFNNIKKQVLKK